MKISHSFLLFTNSSDYAPIFPVHHYQYKIYALEFFCYSLQDDFPTNNISDEKLKQGLSDLSLDDLRVLNKLVDLEKQLYDDYDYDR